MARERWIPLGWSYPNEDAAQGELEALRSAGVRCELHETKSGAFTPEYEPKSTFLCIRVLFEHRDLAERILDASKQKQTQSNPPNLCEACGQRSADVHITMFDEHGNSKQHNFCQDCHQEWSPE